MVKRREFLASAAALPAIGTVSADEHDIRDEEFHREIEEYIHQYVNGYRDVMGVEPVVHEESLREEARQLGGYCSSDNYSCQVYDNEPAQEVAYETFLTWVLEDGHDEILKSPDIGEHGVGVHWNGWLQITDLVHE